MGRSLVCWTTTRVSGLLLSTEGEPISIFGMLRFPGFVSGLLLSTEGEVISGFGMPGLSGSTTLVYCSGIFRGSGALTSAGGIDGLAETCFSLSADGVAFATIVDLWPSGTPHDWRQSVG
jgi:hypothetical protein